MYLYQVPSGWINRYPNPRVKLRSLYTPKDCHRALFRKRCQARQCKSCLHRTHHITSHHITATPGEWRLDRRALQHPGTVSVSRGGARRVERFSRGKPAPCGDGRHSAGGAAMTMTQEVPNAKRALLAGNPGAGCMASPNDDSPTAATA